MTNKKDEFNKLKNQLEKISISEDKQLVILYEIIRNKILGGNKDILKIKTNKSEEKLQLIGLLPFILLDRSYFPSNSVLANFAEKNLHIIIPSWNKRSRDEILGKIISEVSEKNTIEIVKLSNTLKKIINKKGKGDMSNFFLEWEKIIKENENI